MNGTTPPRAPRPASVQAGTPVTAAPAPQGISVSALSGMVKSYKPLPRAPSALQAVGNVLDIPFFAADALARGGKPFTNTAELGKVTKEVVQHGSRGLEDVSERYNLFSPEQLKDESSHGNPVAKHFLAHPQQAAIADFAAEAFLNPSNLIVPPIGRLAGKLIGGAAKFAGKAPAIGRAATTLRDTFNPSAGLRDEGGIRAQDAGRQYTQAASVGADDAHKRLDPIFRGTTMGDRHEIERRSENFTAHGIVNPQARTPTVKLSDADLDARAKTYRNELDRLDAEQLQHGTVEKKNLFTNHAYTPRYGAYGKIYAPEDHLTDEQKAFYEDSKGHSAFGGSAKSYGGTTIGKRKTLFTYDDAARKGLSPDYDPANNAELHFKDRLKKIELKKSKGAFVDAGVLHDVVLQRENGPGQPNTVYGTNKPGMAALNRDTDIAARKMSRAEAIANLQANGVGITKPPRGVNLGALKAKAQGAVTNAKTAVGAEATIASAFTKQQARTIEVLARRADQNEAAAQAILADVTSSAERRATATRDLTNVQTFRQRLKIAQTTKTDGLPGGTASAYRDLKKMLPQMGAAGMLRKLTPGQRAIFGADTHGGIMRDAAERNIGAAENATATASKRMERLNAANQQQQMAADAERLSSPVRAAVAKASRGSQQAARQATAAITHYAYGKITEQQNIAFTREAARLFPGIKTRLRDSIVNTSIREAEKKGFVKLNEGLSRQFGPEGYLVMGKPKTIKYLLDMGAPAKEATGIAAAFDTINKLTRIGIISNPFVHVIWNLNTQFLGAGGRPEDFLKIYGNRVSPGSIARAEKYGAIARFADSGQGLFGLSYGKKIGAGSDLNIGQQADRQMSRAYDYNNHIVFHHFETRFSASLFDHFVSARKATTEEELMQAGRDVRKALGDYANVSHHGVEGIANKMFFFYPWLKTVVPFWLAAIVEHPGRVNAPLEAVRTSNQLMGDPDVPNEGPFKAYLGKAKGGAGRYATLPVPIRLANDALTLAAPRGEVGGGVNERVSDVLRVAGTHANPVVGSINDAIITSAAPAQEPGGANYHTMYNRDAPPQDQWKQFGTAAAERLIPLPLQVKQMILYADEVINRSKGDPVGDAVAGTAFGVLGGSTYDKDSPQAARRIRAIQSVMIRLSNRYQQNGEPDKAEAIYQKMQKMMDAAKRGAP